MNTIEKVTALMNRAVLMKDPRKLNRALLIALKHARANKNYAASASILRHHMPRAIKSIRGVEVFEAKNPGVKVGVDLENKGIVTIATVH